MAAAARPRFFASREKFRAWLEKNHGKETELFVGFYRKGSGKRSITYDESVEEALCFGWIDGVVRRIDDASYMQRFTPRKRGSIWSRVNIARAHELIRQNRMHSAGLRAFEARDETKTGYLFERRDAPELPRDMQSRLRRNAAAFTFFSSQPPGYQRLALWWVVSAKRPETQKRRFETLLSDSAAGRRIGPLRPEERRRRAAADHK